VAGYAKDVLVDTEWVATRLHDPAVRIVEVDENRSLYHEAHIPGAIGLDWSDVRRPSPDEFAALLGGKGISDEHLIVLYGDRNNWFAAAVYWFLKLHGHGAVRLMDGPREKWISEGRPTSSQIPSYPPEAFTVTAGDASIRALRDDVIAAVGTRTRLVDVRSPQEFAGSHVEGVASVPWAQAIKEDGSFRSREELEAIYRAQGLLDGDPIIACCRIGERSAHTWFVLHELLGIDGVRNYDGSATEWDSALLSRAG
jgi:thiosulfate/3-mercaptopyruvate sulfurtransferase